MMNNFRTTLYNIIYLLQKILWRIHDLKRGGEINGLPPSGRLLNIFVLSLPLPRCAVVYAGGYIIETVHARMYCKSSNKYLSK